MLFPPEKKAEKKPLFSLQELPAPSSDVPRLPAGNLATGTLKLIALLFMLIDHLGAVVFTGIPEMRILGRLALPIYCWCMVVGFHYTRSTPRYLLRILAVGLISQPLYAITMNHALTKPNIFLTLFLGLLGLWGLRERKYYSHIWGPVLVLVLAQVLGVDYGWKGVLFLMLLYACRGSRGAIAAVMTAFFLFWGTSYPVTPSLLGLRVDLDAPSRALTQAGLPLLSDLVRGFTAPLSAFLRLETYGLAALIFILPRYRRNLRMPVWLGYAIYPLHLLLVLLIKTLVL